MDKRDAKDNPLVTTAKVIGKAAGKIAALTGTSKPESSEQKAKPSGKLPKKDKSRLPRRQKKAQKKAAARLA